LDRRNPTVSSTPRDEKEMPWSAKTRLANTSYQARVDECFNPADALGERTDERVLCVLTIGKGAHAHGFCIGIHASIVQVRGDRRARPEWTQIEQRCEDAVAEVRIHARLS
jgi:hypothetical protein